MVLLLRARLKVVNWRVVSLRSVASRKASAGEAEAAGLPAAGPSVWAEAIAGRVAVAPNAANEATNSRRSMVRAGCRTGAGWVKRQTERLDALLDAARAKVGAEPMAPPGAGAAAPVSGGRCKTHLVPHPGLDAEFLPLHCQPAEARHGYSLKPCAWQTPACPSPRPCHQRSQFRQPAPCPGAVWKTERGSPSCPPAPRARKIACH